VTLEPLTCNNCGAALDIPASANFVTCVFCGSRLAVKSNASVVDTEVLQQLDERTQRLSTDVQQLQLESELERIDREWEQERQPYLLSSPTGATFEPTIPWALLTVGVAAIFAGVVALLFFTLWGGVLTSNPISGVFVLALLLLGLAAWETFKRIYQADNYKRAKIA
jgi:hypothetical protein